MEMLWGIVFPRERSEHDLELESDVMLYDTIPIYTILYHIILYYIL